MGVIEDLLLSDFFAGQVVRTRTGRLGVVLKRYSYVPDAISICFDSMVQDFSLYGVENNAFISIFDQSDFFLAALNHPLFMGRESWVDNIYAGYIAATFTTTILTDDSETSQHYLAEIVHGQLLPSEHFDTAIIAVRWALQNLAPRWRATLT